MTALLRALDTVRDPELDEPITALGFVAACDITAAGDALVRLRLPTYFCAPNFAFLMVADAYDAVSAIPGVRETPKSCWRTISPPTPSTAGVAAQAGFAQSFDGEAVGELHELRADFLRKAVMAGTDQVCRPLLAAGTAPAELPGSRWARCRRPGRWTGSGERRAELGLPAGDDAPLLIDPKTGEPVSPAATPIHLRRARLTRTSIESNGSICRGMLQHRYDSRAHGRRPVRRANSESRRTSEGCQTARVSRHSR